MNIINSFTLKNYLPSYEKVWENWDLHTTFSTLAIIVQYCFTFIKCTQSLLYSTISRYFLMCWSVLNLKLFWSYIVWLCEFHKCFLALIFTYLFELFMIFWKKAFNSVSIRNSSPSYESNLMYVFTHLLKCSFCFVSAGPESRQRNEYIIYV